MKLKNVTTEVLYEQILMFCEFVDISQFTPSFG